ncbi:hypothetical protein HS088_TW21G01166 [Tripterygium wilfordii]|uniref:Late embryogenesis abundant protein LEA-2 subgroup domain-containing protein n=1 Tax=Tripterygium wilfordii TaxID=458696 RepID=A0A7J7C4B9_TRIWF|nr:protein NDR1-like [Tripterygium wilfordii]KAF5729009.1 hypothetical protein HS088_TW21G01166 [Tripterygium wilfordii]
MVFETSRFYLWFLQIIALLGLLALCLWLSLRPKEPTHTISNFSVPPLANARTTSPCMNQDQNSTFCYDLAIKNPNKDSTVTYDVIALTFFLGQDNVGVNSIHAFQQSKDQTLQLPNHVNTTPKIQKALLRAISNATAELKVALSTRIQYKTWGIKSKHHNLDLQGVLKIGSDGKLSNKKGKVELARSSKKLKLRSSRWH